MCFGDLELHSHFDIFSFGVNRNGPGMNSKNLTGPWDNFMVHGVNNP